jgi:alanine dehydrogenase
MTRMLTNEDLQGLITPQECIVILEEAYRQHGEGVAIGTTSRVETILPTEVPGVDFEFTSMEGAVPSLGVMAFRCNSNHMRFRMVNGMKRKDRLPDAPQNRFVGLIFLFSIAELKLLAILQDGLISSMRVGATSALAFRELSRADACVVGLLGAGVQARSQLECLAAVRELKDVRVFSPTPEKRNRFTRLMSEQIGIAVRSVDTASEAVKGADILVAATNSFEPVFETDWVEPGMHVSSILTYEVPPEMYQRADVVVVNVKQGYGTGKAGHLDTSADWASYPSLGELLIGQIPGRIDSDQVTFFMNNAGVGFQFAATSARALELAEKAGIGQEIPDDLFLQSWQT